MEPETVPTKRLKTTGYLRRLIAASGQHGWDGTKFESSTSEPVSRPKSAAIDQNPDIPPGVCAAGLAGPVGIEVDMGTLPAAIWRSVRSTRFRARLCSSLSFRKR